jgi:hypothetical protein
VVKIEYKYCPNLTIIDTPGLISAPSKGRASPLQGQARAVEALVKQKMENRDYIILCLEDTSDWSNATTRNLVLEVRDAGSLSPLSPSLCSRPSLSTHRSPCRASEPCFLKLAAVAQHSSTVSLSSFHRCHSGSCSPLPDSAH